MEYDESVIVKHANSLLEQAKNMVFIYTAFGLMLMVGAWAFSQQLPNFRSVIDASGVLIAALFYWRGKAAAAGLVLQAHTILLQVQIERNTRPTDA